MTYPAESFYRATIRQSIADNTSVPFTLKVSKIPKLTAWLLTISSNTSNEELVEYNWVDGTALTITVVKRWINPSSQSLLVAWTDYNNVLYQKSHSQNISIRWDVNHLHLIQDYWTLETTKLNKTAWLRDWMGAGRKTVEIDATWAEVTKSIIDWTTILGTDTLRKRKMDGSYEEIPYSIIINAVNGITSEYPFWWSASVNDSIYFSDIKKYSTWFVDIWKTTAFTDILFYSKWATEQKYTFYFKKFLSPQDLTVRIETDNWSWVRSWTLVNANAVLVTSIASIPTEWLYEISFPASFINAPLWTPVHFVFWQGSQAINATNYLQVATETECVVVYDNMSSPWSNIASTRNPLSTSSTSWAYSQSMTFIANVNCQLMSLNWNFPSWVTSMTIVWPWVNFNFSTLVTTFYEIIMLQSGWTYTITITWNWAYVNVNTWNNLVNWANVTMNLTALWFISNITTRTVTITENAWFLRTYISKALWTTTIKSAVYWMLPSWASAWTYPIFIKDGYIGWFTWLSKGSTYYLSNTWAASLTPWTISKVLWIAINSTMIKVDSAIETS